MNVMDGGGDATSIASFGGSVWVGDVDAGQNMAFLRRSKITVVVNASVEEIDGSLLEGVDVYNVGLTAGTGGETCESADRGKFGQRVPKFR